MARSNKASGVLSILLLLCVGLASFLAYLQYQKQKDILAKERQILEQDQMLFKLQSEVDSVLTELDALDIAHTQLNEVVENQKIEIELQKRKIRDLIRNGQNLDLAKKEIEDLKSKISSFSSEISFLQDSLDNLQQLSTKLKNRNILLADSLILTQKNVQSLSSERDTLLSTSRQLTKENELLDRKVAKASAILVDIQEVKGLKRKKSGEFAKTYKGEKMSGIEICYTMRENLVQEAEIETFYLRVISPGGGTMSSDQKYLITDQESTTSILYSTSFDHPYVAFQQKCVQWETDLTFGSGTYNLELYNKGYRVGQSTLFVK